MSTSMERLKTIQRHVIGRNQSCSAENIQPHKVSSSGDTGKIATIPSSQDEQTYTYIKVKTMGKNNNIGYIELDRPKVMNAIFDPLMMDVCSALDEFEANDDISCVILTGSTKAFSVGADINQMAPVSKFADIYKSKHLANWDRITSFRKPLIAAVDGYAYGGGCEIAMMCDIIYASSRAKFGQPEIKIGIIPGAGGTQRLPRAVGKSKAMELCLSGDPMSAEEALKFGLVAGVFPPEQLLDKCLEKAERIALNSPLILSMCKEAVNKSFETTLAEGLNFEKRIFHSTFATADRLEGMMAFVEKRKPQYSNE